MDAKHCGNQILLLRSFSGDIRLSSDLIETMTSSATIRPGTIRRTSSPLSCKEEEENLILDLALSFYNHQTKLYCYRYIQ